MVRARLTVCIFALVCSFSASLSRADAVQALRIQASAESMRIDGALAEWKGASFSELGSGGDASLRYALADADDGLYIGAEVRDERLVTGDKGDALVLTLAMPVADSERWVTTEIYLYPGAVGETKARSQVVSAGKAHSEPGIKLVEGPRKEGAGYVLEAFVPWSTIAGAQIWEQGRGSLRFVDVDGKGVESTVASATGAAAALPRLTLAAGGHDLLGSFLDARQLRGSEPRYDFRSDVSGDAAPERIVIIESYVVVYGPGYRHGETFNYFTLPFSVGGGLKSASLIDLTGDGRRELVVTVRQQNQLGARDAWLVLSLADETMRQLFGVELRKEVQGGFLEDNLTVLPEKVGSKLKTIEVKLGRSSGLNADNYHETPATNIEPILLPWGELKARRYAFDGIRFKVIDETRQNAPAQASISPAAVAAKTQREPEPAAANESIGPEDVLALFKEQQKLARSTQPDRSLSANVLSAGAPERIDLFGKVLVFTGPDIALGKGYLTYSLPISAASDLLELRSADVTADGGAELLARIKQPLSGGAVGVERELLLVLRGDDQARIGRVLLAEVARRQGKNAIENKVVTQAGALVIEPGHASGWNQVSYPFTREPTAGAAPLLLPWLDRAVRYHRDGALLVPVP